MLSPNCVPIPLSHCHQPVGTCHSLLNGLPAIVPGSGLGTSPILTHLFLPTTAILQMRKLKHQEIQLLVKGHTLASGKGKAGISSWTQSGSQVHAHNPMLWGLSSPGMVYRPLLGLPDLAVTVLEVHLQDTCPSRNSLMASL